MAHVSAHAAGVRPYLPRLREGSRRRRRARGCVPRVLRQKRTCFREGQQVMIEYSVSAPTIPIPFHRLLRIVALVDETDRDARVVLDQISAENFQVEFSRTYERDVLADADVGAYVVSIDGDNLDRA